MKNQQELEQYLDSRGLVPPKYMIIKERGSWAQDINYIIVVAEKMLS